MFPVILLHGLGATPYTLWPLMWYLQSSGFSDVYVPKYNVDKQHADESLTQISTWLSDQGLDMIKDELIVIGQSFGGLMAHRLHQKGWRIRKSISIGSPLHGARLIAQLAAVLPQSICDWVRKRKIPYSYLQHKDKEDAPPHPYHTVSMGWFWSDFDGCVYRNETVFDDKYHSHLSFSDHRTAFVDPRLFTLVCSLVNDDAQI